MRFCIFKKKIDANFINNVIYLFIQHLLSVLFTNKYALMRYVTESENHSYDLISLKVTMFHLHHAGIFAIIRKYQHELFES